MTPVSPTAGAESAPSGSALGFDRFLRSVERRAIRIAELGEELHPRAVEHVARAMADLAKNWPTLSEADWAVEFWRRLHRRLDAARGNAAARAFERHGHADEDSAAEGADPLAGPDALVHLEAALRSLSSPQRLVFLLRVWEGLELPIVAAALDLTPDAAKAELFHALQRLHGRLAPGAQDRRWVLRCRELLDGWAQALEPASLAPLAVVRRAIARPVPVPDARGPDRLRRFGLAALLVGAAVLGWRGVSLWLAQPAVAPPSVSVLEAEAPPPAIVELAPVAAPDYELLADAEQYALLQELDFYTWHAREHGTDD